MPNLNENYLKLQENYLFSEIAHRVADVYEAASGKKSVIRLGNRRCHTSSVSVCRRGTS